MPLSIRKFFRFRIKRLSQPTERPHSKEPLSYPLGLSQDQVEALRSLRETSSWRHFLVALERVYEQQLGSLLSGAPHDNYLFQAGVCHALERAATLIDDLSAKARDIDAWNAARAAGERNTNDAALPAVFGSPYFNEWRRRAASTGGPDGAASA